MTGPLSQPGASETALGLTGMSIVFTSSNLELVQLRTSVGSAQSIAGEAVVTTESFDASLVQQQSGRVVMTLQRVTS